MKTSLGPPRRRRRKLASIIGGFDASDIRYAAELGYGRWVPFEVVPFAWQGGDALRYGHLVMGEELGATDWPTVVSFAPSELVVSWLGDDPPNAVPRCRPACCGVSC